MVITVDVPRQLARNSGKGLTPGAIEKLSVQGMSR